MLKTTTWRPDTCGCEVDYQWDTDVPQESRTHTVTRHVKCALHATDDGSLVLGDNQRKNITLGLALENISALRDGTAGSYTLKSGISFEWSYDEARVLHVTFTGVSLTQNQRNTLQGLLDNRFGAGRVVLT